MKALLILSGILKGIGIVLLVLLLLLLLSVLFLLASPIRYRLEGEKKEALGGSFGVRWLMGAVRAEGCLGGTEGLCLRLKVLWFTLLGDEKKQKKQKKQQKQPAEQTPPPKKPPEPEKKSPPIEPPVPDLAAAEKWTEPPKPPQQKMAQQPKIMRRVALAEIEEKPPEDLDEDLDELDEEFFTGEEMPDAAEKSERIPPIFKKIWAIEDKKGIFRAIGKLMKRILRGILPRHFHLSGTFGLGEPAQTGYLLGLVGILQAKFGRDIEVRGDFERLAAEDIEIRLEGKIRLGSLLCAMLAFMLAKPVRRAIGRLWKERKAEKGKDEQNG